MKYLILILTIISFNLSGQGIEPSSLQPSPYLHGILKAVTPIVDEFTGATNYLYVHADSLQVSSGSIDSTIVLNSYGTIITESPANTWNVKVDTSKIATQYDLTLISGGGGTVSSVDGTGGTGISVTGGPITTTGTLTITNTAPDQTVVLTEGGITDITGTYPNFTITSTEVDGSISNEIQYLTLLDSINRVFRLQISDGNTVKFKDIDTNSGGTVTSITVNAPVTGGVITTTGTIGLDTTLITGVATQYDLTQINFIDSTIVTNGTGISVTQSPANTFTVTNTDPDQSTTNEKITALTWNNIQDSLQVVENGVIYRTKIDGFLSSEVDGDISNELQTIAVTGTTTGITTLSNSGGSMTIAGAGINTVGVSGSTITITGTESDGSIINEGALSVGVGGANSSSIQSNTLGSNTVTISGGVGIGVSEVSNTITITNTVADSTVINGGYGIDVTESPTNTYGLKSDTSEMATQYDLTLKQNTLVSGTNIKTVNSNSLLGSGDVSVGTVTSVTAVAPLTGGAITGSGSIGVDTTSSTGLATQYDILGLGGLSGSGTTNYIPKWSSSTSLGNSLGYDNGTTFSVGASGSPNSAGAFESKKSYTNTSDANIVASGNLPAISYNTTGSYRFTQIANYLSGDRLTLLGASSISSDPTTPIVDYYNSGLIDMKFGAYVGGSLRSGTSGGTPEFSFNNGTSSNPTDVQFYANLNGGQRFRIQGGNSLSYMDFYTPASGSNRNYSFATSFTAAGDFQLLRSTTAGGTPTTSVFSANSTGFGIGTLIPQKSLDVTGELRVSSLDTDLTAPTTSGTTKTLVSDANGDVSFIPTTSGTLTSIATSSPITGGTITSSGTIGLDTTSSTGAATQYDLTLKQATLVSGTNIKTVNSNSLLGSGNVSVGTVTSITANSPLTGGTITASGSIGVDTTSTTGLATQYDLTQIGGSGTVTSIATNNGITGGTITTSGTIGLTGQALALHNLATNGIVARTSSGAFSARTLTAGTGITITNGNGVSGNPVIDNTGMTSLNGLTNGSQAFAWDASGSDFGIASTGFTHTFSLPTASGSNRGALSSSDWTTFNGKMGGTGSTNKVPYFTSSNALSFNSNFHWDNTNGRLGVGTSSPQTVMHVAGDATSGNGLLMQNKQAMATNLISQQILSIGSGSGYSSTERYYALKNTATSSSNSDFSIRYWNGSSETNRFSINSGGNVTIPDLSTGGSRNVICDANGTLSTATLSSGTVTSVQLNAGSGISLSGTNPITSSGIITVTNSDPDQSLTNEGFLGVGSGGSNDALLRGYNSAGTTTGNGTTIAGGWDVIVTESTSANGGTITYNTAAPYTMLAGTSSTLSISTSYTKMFQEGGSSSNGDALYLTYDNANDEIDVTTTGTYKIEYTCNCKSNTASHLVTFDILNNSGLASLGLPTKHYFNNTNEYCHNNATWILPITAGTSFSLYAKTDTGTPNINDCSIRVYAQRLK